MRTMSLTIALSASVVTLLVVAPPASGVEEGVSLVDGSRLIGVQSYSDETYDLTGGVHAARELGTASRVVENNLAATFEPLTDSIYFLTNAFVACELNRLDLADETVELVGSVTFNGTTLSGCWGLTTLAGPTASLAAGSSIYSVDLTTGVASAPRETPCRGFGMALDPTSAILYVGDAIGGLWSIGEESPGGSLVCTFIRDYPMVNHDSGQNFKGMAFDSDGTLYTLAHWPPALFSLDPDDESGAVTAYGDLRIDAASSPLPIESLSVAYTADPVREEDPTLPGDGGEEDPTAPEEGAEEDPTSPGDDGDEEPASLSELPQTGLNAGVLAGLLALPASLLVGAGLIALGVSRRRAAGHA